MADCVAQSTCAADLQHHTGDRGLSSCCFLPQRKDILYADDKFETFSWKLPLFMTSISFKNLVETGH